jgi:putative transposase
VVAPHGETTHWATNDLGMDEAAQLVFAELSPSIEEYHRGLKQSTGVERCHILRSACGQRNPIDFAIRAIVRLEYHRFPTVLSWFAAKEAIICDAVRA